MNKYIQRLSSEWLEHGKIIIAVDYDDTISPWKFSTDEDFKNFSKVIKLLQQARQVGAYIVIFTACAEERYPEILHYCEKQGLHVDTINKTPLDLPYGKYGKIYANIFLDDRAGLTEALDTLEKAMYHVIGTRTIKDLTDIA